MEKCLLLVLSCLVVTISSWSLPYPPAPRAPVRVYRYAPPPPQHHHTPVEQSDPMLNLRPKRGHSHSHDYDEPQATSGVTGPVHTFVKTDKNANYKWGVRHHVGDKYS